MELHAPISDVTCSALHYIPYIPYFADPRIAREHAMPSIHVSETNVAACSCPQINASNNAGDTPWHWASNMGNEDVMTLLEKVG